jgi:hypothetical protein
MVVVGVAVRFLYMLYKYGCCCDELSPLAAELKMMTQTTSTRKQQQALSCQNNNNCTRRRKVRKSLMEVSVSVRGWRGKILKLAQHRSFHSQS